MKILLNFEQNIWALSPFVFAKLKRIIIKTKKTEIMRIWPIVMDEVEV